MQTMKGNNMYDDIKRGVPFMRNPCVKDEEKIALSNYRDNGVRGHNWDYPIPANRDRDKDCYIVNNYLRGKLNMKQFLSSDKNVKFLDELLIPITNATNRCTVKDSFEVYRGLDTDWINIPFDNYGNPLSNRTTFIDKSFGSFTSWREKAIDYSHRFGSNEIVLLALTLKPTNHGVYIDDREFEWLLPRNNEYNVYFKYVGINQDGIKQTTYYITTENE